MSISRNMTGTPWHVERTHRSEGDARRYKGRCKSYDYGTGQCRYYHAKCYGSAHCDHYVAISEDEFRQRQKLNRKGSSSFDNDFELPSAKTVDETVVERTEPEVERPKRPSIKLYIGQEISHTKYGIGRVTAVDDKYVFIEFDEVGEKQFGYPDAIVKGFLSVVDGK